MDTNTVEFEDEITIKPNNEINTELDLYRHLCLNNLENVPVIYFLIFNLIINAFSHLFFLKYAGINLKCRYRNSNPYLIIGPVKEEQIHDDPPIWVYHDVITQKQADRMIKLAEPLV